MKANHAITEANSGMFGDDACREIILSSGKDLLPLTHQWASGAPTTTKEAIANRTCVWVFDEMMNLGTGHIGTPETMGPSLPFLDKICVLCAIGCAFLQSMMVGDKQLTELSWMLLKDGVDREMYEWDSSFVERLTGSMSVECPKRISEFSVAMDELLKSKLSTGCVVKKYISNILLSCMLGKPVLCLPLTDQENSIRLECIMRSHFEEVGQWFSTHMEVYGPIYEALSIGRCE